MPVINILSPHVADMIAAGEVVERPASVVKELVENAFDAGGRNITVELRGGGATYIRVTDDGCGMAPEDAGVAFLRHATSKLKDERGLESIGTMGFRGEALAAIAAVSRIELSTRLTGSDEGTYMTLESGDIGEMRPTGCPEGTTIIVRDLFFNTPARLKFLKSDKSEGSACILAALRCALGRPEVSLRLIRDGQEEFFSPGDGRADSCIYTLLGRDMASSMLKCTSSEDGLSVSGFVSSPAAGRGNRAQQYFFCNGRFIKSVLLQTAVEQAYKNTLLTGRYPACVLYLNIGLGSVDVNVHPAKTEVKFSFEKAVFDLVYRAVRVALEGESESAQIKLSPSTEQKLKPKADFFRQLSAEEFRNSVNHAEKKTETTDSTRLKSGELPYQTQISMPPAQSPTVIEPKISASTASPSPRYSGAVENPVQNVESSRPLPHKIVGEAMKTYIIVERGDELILIDKHAAHERIIFDTLRAQEQDIMAQALLTPVTLRLSGSDGELIEQNGELLSALGFEIEPFGAGSYVIRAVPADMDAGDIPAAIEEICEKLRRGRLMDAKGVRDEILHTVACKAAIKAGWETQGAELETLVEAVLSGRVKYCPHGRPVSVTMTRKELDKQFKRIV